jgi:outer membrane protein assembly factor BamB
MDKRFSEGGWPGSPDQPPQPQSGELSSPGQSRQSWPAWSAYPEQTREQEITQFPRYRAQPPRPEWTPERRRPRFSPLFIFWAVLTCLLIAGTSSFVTFFLLRHPALSQNQVKVSPPASAPSSVSARQTATLAAPTVPRGSLYTAQEGAIYRYDLQRSQLQQPMQPVWSVQAVEPTPPLIVGNKMFFSNAQTPGSFLEAVDLPTGKQLWKNTAYSSGFLLSSGDMLYDAGCLDTLDSTGAFICTLDGINASTGARRWSYPLSGGSAWIALQNGVIYVVSYTNYFAINATTGKLVWQRNLLRYTDQNANMTPAVGDNMLSFASCNVTKQSRGAPGCYLYAFDAGTGSELWHMYTTQPLMISPVIAHGVIYAGTGNGTVYALDERSGKKLWAASVGGGPIGQIQASADTVYAEILSSSGQTVQIEAFDAATHLPRWGQSQSGASTSFNLPARSAPLLAQPHFIPRIPLHPFSAGPSDNPFILDRGLIYLHDTPTTISVLNASDGSTITQYYVQNISGFTVVTP